MDVADVVWPGFHYDGRTAHREAVRVAIAGECLRITRSDGAIIEWPIQGLRQSQGAHGDRLRFEFGEDPVESLVIEGPGLAEAISVLVPSANRRLKARRSPWRAIAVLVVMLGAIGGVYLWGAPLFATWLAPRVPVAWEQQLGDVMAEGIFQSKHLCKDVETVAGVQTVLDRVLQAVPARNYTFRLFVLNDSSVNAFAAPGGVIVVHSGLLRAAGNPEELAMVLAHEAQHVLQRHSTRALIREIPLRMALASFGDGGLGSAATIGSTLGVLRYRRDDERDADNEGMQMLQRVRIDATAAARFMRTLEGRSKDVPRFASYVSSHPLSADRAQSLERLASTSRYDPMPILSDADWAQVRKGCEY